MDLPKTVKYLTAYAINACRDMLRNNKNGLKTIKNKRKHNCIEAIRNDGGKGGKKIITKIDFYGY
jgi:hypothetical protein